MSVDDAAGFDYSLLLIWQPKFTIQVVVVKRDDKPEKIYRGRFVYRGIEYCLKITDPLVRDFYEEQEAGEYPVHEVYLCLSLTERYEGDGRCHKLVAAVLVNSVP